MAYPLCNVVYVDKRALGDRYQGSGGPDDPGPAASKSNPSRLFDTEIREVQFNLRALLSVFSGVHVCTTGVACITKIRELDASIADDCRPTLVVIDVYTELDVEGPHIKNEHSTSSPKSPNPRRELSASSDPEDFYSIQLLQHIANEIAYSNYSKLIIPVALTHNLEDFLTVNHPMVSGRPTHLTSDQYNRLSKDATKELFDPALHGPSAPVDPKRMIKCLEAGAVDVISSPLDKSQVSRLVVHVHRAHKEGIKDQAAFLATMRLRKRSWVGMDNEVPYAYLRESMVSHLMTSICKPESVLNTYDSRNLYIIDYRRDIVIANAIARWDFSAHDFSEDELVHAAFLMLQHALQLPDLEKWRLSADDLKTFLMACRAAYNGFVLYHNFRHVIDVLQAVFYFLLQLGTLPPYPTDSTAPDASKSVSPIAAILTPFDALTLLISAIGHDVGHPGVNNAFLVALKAPLAQLYNDISVLEAFHCAAYSQILRRYWTVAFEDTDMRSLLIKSILATDMGVHFKYMTDLGNLQSKLSDNNGTDGWAPQVLEEIKVLVCGLLIKCADISNVARPFDVAAKWSDILQLEFARQGEMEKDVGIPTTLFGGPPEIGNVTKLANSQIGFMNIFAYPLFGAVADILPNMKFALDEVEANKDVWKNKIDDEKSKEQSQNDGAKYFSEGFQSPRSGSPDRLFAVSSSSSHPEGLPASGSTPSLPASPPMNSSQSVPDLPQNSKPEPYIDPEFDTRGMIIPMGEPNTVFFPGIPPIYPNVPGEASRYSSGVYPAAHMAPPIVSTRRRSSNTLPSQLHMGLGSSGEHPMPISENTQPMRPSPDNMLFSAVDVAARDGFASGPRAYGSTSTGTSGGSSGGRHRGEKFNDGDDSTTYSMRNAGQPFTSSHSGRHSAQQSSGRYSAFSSQDRFSNATSGAHTFASHVLPNSPTETQATSFLTDGSDVGSAEFRKYLTPADLGLDRPRSEDNQLPSSASSMYTSSDVKSGVNGHAVHLGERTIRKKNSRFRFDFWKKKAKEGSSPGSP